MAGPDAEADARDPRPRAPSRSRLASRVLVTWFELTAVWLVGGVLGSFLSGPPAFVVFLTTSLLSVAVLLYNVNELVRTWLQPTAGDADD